MYMYIITIPPLISHYICVRVYTCMCIYYECEWDTVFMLAVGIYENALYTCCVYRAYISWFHCVPYYFRVTDLMYIVECLCNCFFL